MHYLNSPEQLHVKVEMISNRSKIDHPFNDKINMCTSLFPTGTITRALLDRHQAKSPVISVHALKSNFLRDVEAIGWQAKRRFYRFCIFETLHQIDAYLTMFWNQ